MVIRHSHRGLWTLASLVFTIATAASLAVAKSSFVVALPNGYYIEWDGASLARIIKRGGRVVVPAPIAAYAVFRHIVVGVHGNEAPSGAGYANALPYKRTSDSRYFVLDTVSGGLDSELDEPAWRARRKEAGVPVNL